jgi:type I restriction enzyme S subunit
MIEGLKPYAEYKESGVPWIGRVPSDWRVERTKWIFRSRKELNVGRRNTNVLSLTLRGVVNNDPDSPEGMVPKDYATYQLFRKHDLVFKLIDLENIRTSRVGLVHEDGIMSSAYVRLAPSKSVNIRFFYFQFFDLYTRAVFNALGAGVRSTLGATDLGELRIAVPSPDEQAAIVRFLDHANRKIDGFIRAKRKLIGLLNEQKQAIIHRAVTGKDEVRMVKDENGNSSFILQPSTLPKKPSGIPWLGDIPKHWEQHSLWTLTKLRMDRNPGNLQLLSVFLDRGVIRYDEGGGQVHAPSLDLSNYQVAMPGDFVLNNQQAWRGSVGVSFHHGIISPAYIVLKLSRKLDPTFTNYLMRSRSMVDQFVAASKGVGDIQRQVFWPYLRMVQVPVPNLKEQAQIVEYLTNETRSLNTAIARAEREIALMQEYRTRLTADIVTGKLDVREAAAKLPELAEGVALGVDALDEAEELSEEEAE